MVYICVTPLPITGSTYLHPGQGLQLVHQAIIPRRAALLLAQFLHSQEPKDVEAMGQRDSHGPGAETRVAGDGRDGGAGVALCLVHRKGKGYVFGPPTRLPFPPFWSSACVHARTHARAHARTHAPSSAPRRGCTQ